MACGLYRPSLDERSHMTNDDIVILVDVWYQLTQVDLDNKLLKQMHLCVTCKYLVKMKFNPGVQAIFKKTIIHYTAINHCLLLQVVDNSERV